jgi:hypothetical protein
MQPLLDPADPSSLARIPPTAPIIRLAKHAFYNVTAHKLEKLRSVFYLGYFSRLEIFEQRILLRFTQGHERHVILRGAIAFQSPNQRR